MLRTTPPSIDRRDAGFTIIEVLIALALVAVSILAIGSVMSTNVRGVRLLEQHVTLMQTARSVMTADMIRIPDDVRFDALLPQTCNRRAALSTISFFASGMSCGGAIALTRLDAGYEIRVNWLTGRIEIAPHNAAIN